MIAQGIIAGMIATCHLVASGKDGTDKEGKMLWRCVTEAPAESVLEAKEPGESV